MKSCIVKIIDNGLKNDEGGLFHLIYDFQYIDFFSKSLCPWKRFTRSLSFGRNRRYLHDANLTFIIADLFNSGLSYFIIVRTREGTKS